MRWEVLPCIIIHATHVCWLLCHVCLGTVLSHIRLRTRRFSINICKSCTRFGLELSRPFDYPRSRTARPATTKTLESIFGAPGQRNGDEVVARHPVRLGDGNN